MIQFKRFFSTDSAKAIKADKYGYLNGINYMAPHTTGGDFDLCGKSSAGCRSLCLGFYSGQAGMVKDLENGTNSVRDSRIRKAQYFMNDRHAFMAEMTDHIKKLSNTAKNKNKALCVRLNGSTDLAFESMKVKLQDNKTVTELFPTIQFVDYTKHIKRLLNKNRPANYHLTFSLSETNKAEAIQALKLGFNVAVVFGHGLPKEYLGYPVIDGTEHDLRHLDPKGVIVGLDPKGSKAKNDQTGFVVRDY
jgi:hypothetical protein